MDVRGMWGSRRRSCRGTTLAGSAVVLLVVLLSCSSADAIPAFARKYGMPCSSCHEAWPKLSPFGQQFKDNGYQMGNDRDAPIFQSPAYWPIALRITPNWHMERNENTIVDGPGGPNSATATVTTRGFDYTGMDMLTAGTLANNVSFLLVPSSDETGAFHFESANVRFDNLLGTSWVNVKVGKFELDNLLSEKRILALSSNGGFYQNYHFQPWLAPGTPSPSYVFGLGDNQLGVEWMGHSRNDRTRVSAALLQGTDGNPDFQSGIGGAAGRGYEGYIAASQAFEIGSLGLQRVGGFAYFGQAPTFTQYTQNGGDPIFGTGIGNKPYYRAGFIGMWYFKKLDFTTMYFYGHDNVFLATGTASNLGADGLPSGAHAPSWNGALIETHYTWSPQLILVNRYELIRMKQQALDGNPGDLGNVDALTFGFRYYPFINTRAGFAFHNEYSIVWNRKVQISPTTGLPIDLTSSSLFFGFDFAF
jgi:hypothetical protein